VAAGERRLTRLGYDVHDGPLQDVGAARRELCLVRGAVAGALSPGPGRDAVLDQLASIEEIVAATEAGLRELAQATASPAILARPFRTLVENEVARFRAATGVEVETQLEGDLDALTGSQRIALAHVVQEALTNVREHTSAAHVHVSVVRRPDRVEAEIVDDGQGFDVERTLVRAARRGRLGLVGMSERALLLGGALDIRSGPGGPTTVSVTLPEWRPLATAGDVTSDPEDLDAALML
jgi:signal transduction histidine kinase